MKAILILAASLFSVVSYACPQLAGTYACNYDGQIEVTTINQGVQNGITYYEVDGDVILMDGQPKNFQEVDAVGYSVAQCNGNVAQLQTVADLIENGAVAGTMNTVSNITADAQGMTMQTMGEVNYGGQLYPINETVSCARQ